MENQNSDSESIESDEVQQPHPSEMNPDAADDETGSDIELNSQTSNSFAPQSPPPNVETESTQSTPQFDSKTLIGTASAMVNQLPPPWDKSKEIMTRGEANKMITYRMRGSRPESWEEDISRNTLDTEPFNNVAPASQREPSEFVNANRLKVIQPLLGDWKTADLIAKDHFPIPCAEDREGYSPGYDGVYWLSGLEDFLKVMDVVKRYQVYPRSILDFGCASGRVIRHFAAQTEISEVWGSDINARHIRWLYEFMPPQVKPVFNHCIPTLPIRDNSIDVITAFSVFTHIDTFETCWLAELRRIMHDDGICYVTVHNENTWKVCREEIDNPNNRLVQSILKIDPDVINKIHEPLADTRTVYRFAQAGPYRAQVFHSNNYLRKVWGRFFTIEEILPCYHVRQTVLILRKK